MATDSPTSERRGSRLPSACNRPSMEPHGTWCRQRIAAAPPPAGPPPSPHLLPCCLLLQRVAGHSERPGVRSEHCVAVPHHRQHRVHGGAAGGQLPVLGHSLLRCALLHGCAPRCCSPAAPLPAGRTAGGVAAGLHGLPTPSSAMSLCPWRAWLRRRGRRGCPRGGGHRQPSHRAPTPPPPPLQAASPGSSVCGPSTSSWLWCGRACWWPSS